MYQDDILAEVWRHRDAYTAQHHHSLTAIVADLQARQQRPTCHLVDRRDRPQASSRPRSAAEA